MFSYGQVFTFVGGMYLVLDFGKEFLGHSCIIVDAQKHAPSVRHFHILITIGALWVINRLVMVAEDQF
jgi:hypothetical protein